MKKIILTFIAMLLAGVNTALAQDVAKIGDTPYATLKEAVTAAADGDVIELMADDYSVSDGSEIEINKSLTITGAVDGDGKPLYTIYGKSGATGTNDIFITGNGTVTISNVKIQNFGNNAATNAGHAPLYVSTNFTGTVNLSNIYLSNFNRGGIFLYGGTFNVENCNIDCANSTSGALTKGIEIKGSATGTIKKCEIYNMERSSTTYSSAAIEIYGSGSVTVDGCDIYSNSDGHSTTNGTYGIVSSRVGVHNPSGGTLHVKDTKIDCTNASVSVADSDAYGPVNNYTIILDDCEFKNYIATFSESSAITVNSGEYAEDVYAGPGTITINGGVFTNFAPTEDEGGNIIIKGGTFDNDDCNEYLAEGFVLSKNADGTYGVINEANAVAQIGDYGYETLQAAVDAAAEGDEIVILKDFTLTTVTTNPSTKYNVEINKGVTINGGGNTITASEGKRGIVLTAEGKEVTFKNLTIESNKAEACLWIVGAQTCNLDNTTLDGTNGKSYNQPLTIGQFDGSDKAVLNITNGSVIKTNDEGTAHYAIIAWHPVDITVTGSTLKGWGNVYLKPGTDGSTVNISNSTLTSKGIAGNSNNFGIISVESSDNTIILTDNAITTTAVPESAPTTYDALLNIAAGTGNSIEILGSSTTYTTNDPNYGGLTFNWGSLMDDNHNNVYFDANTKSVFSAVVEAAGNGAQINNSTVSIDGQSLYPLNYEPEVLYFWPKTGGGYEGVYCNFADPFVKTDEYILGDGESIQLIKDVTLTQNMTCPLEEGTLNILFGEYNITKGDYSLALAEGVTVVTNKQTDIFSAADANLLIVETDNGDGTYSYTVGNDVLWSWLNGNDRESVYTSFDQPFVTTAANDNELVELKRDITLTSNIVCQRNSGELRIKFGEFTVNKGNFHVLLPEGSNPARALAPSTASDAGAIIYTDKVTDIFKAASEEGYTILTGPSGDPDYPYFYQAVANDDVNAIARNKQTGILFDDLQTAVDLAQAGQTIELLPAIEGVTIENTVTIDKSITIEGGDYQVTSRVTTGNLYGPRLDPAFHITGPGSVTLNKLNLVAPYAVPGVKDGAGIYSQYPNGSVGILVDETFGDSLVINYSTIATTSRGIDVQSIGGGFVLDVNHSTITSTADDPESVYINSFDSDPHGRGRGINFASNAQSCVANVKFSKIEGYAYPINVSENSGKVELNMTDCSTWGRNIINNWGVNSTFNLTNITANGYNNEQADESEEGQDNEAFAAVVDYKTASYNFYNIHDLKVVANVEADDASDTSASEKFIDLRGTDTTVKITGNSGYTIDDNLKDRVGFVNNNLDPDNDVPEGSETDAFKRMIDATVNNRIYFDDQAKAYFNYWFEILTPFDYDYDGDDEDEYIRIAIDDEKDHTNLYPVVPLEVKVMMTIAQESPTGDPEDMPDPKVLYFGNLQDAFNSEHFEATAQIQLLADVDLDEDIIVRLDRGMDFSLLLLDRDDNLCNVNVSNEASIKLPPLVYAYCDEAQAETLFTSADESLKVIKGVSGGIVTYYVPANVYYADSYEEAAGDPTVEDPEDPDYYQENIDGGLLWIFKDLLSTDADAMLQITPDCYVRLEANVTLDETYTLPIGGDVDNEEVFYLDLNGKTIDGEYKSLVMRLGTAIYTTGTIDIFSSIDPEYTVVYDVLDTPIETTYTDFEGNSKPVKFTHKYYLVKDGLAVIVDPSTYCGDRLTPNFIVKKKVVDAVTGEESWVVLEDETDYTWSLVPPASDDANDKTYIDAKTYVQAIVIEGISFQGTRKADFTILPRDIKDVTASGNEQPWRAEGYTPEDIKNLIELQYFCTTHADPANPVLVRDVDYRISVVGENAAQQAIGYTYSDYTYNGQFTQTDATTVDYTITPGNANSTNLVRDMARYLGALYRASGVTSITYNGVTYSWSTEPDELKGSNWRDDDNHTLVSAIASAFTPSTLPESLTITTDKGDITVNINVTNDPAPAPASTGMYLDVNTYPQVITITAIEGGNYTGTLKLDFTILPEDMIDISKCMVVSDATYTSAPLPPTQNRISVIYKQTAVVADVPTEVEFVLPEEAYTIEVHGALDSYVDAKTYSNAITIVANPDYNVGTDDDPLRFYGTLDADYVIKQRDLADDSNDPEENDNEGIVTLEAYAGEDAPETDPATIYLKWTGGELVPVINGPAPENADDPVTNNINLILNAKKDLAEGQTEADDVEWKLIPADYSYTIEPAPMVDPGIYKVIFTGRGNFCGMREVTVMVLKDINEIASDIEVPLQVIPDNVMLKPSELQDIVVKDGDNELVQGVHYEIVAKSEDGETTYTDEDGIIDDGMYKAIFKGLEPYYMKEVEKELPVVYEYNHYENLATYYQSDLRTNGETSQYQIVQPVSIHVTSGKNMECQVGDKPGSTAVKASSITSTLPGEAEFLLGSANKSFTFKVVGIDDKAFNGCTQLHWVDALALEGYTPSTLTREVSEDGPFSGYPVQSLVYLDGCSDVTGTNYIYKKGENDFRCEELKIYDDIKGDQQGFETDADYIGGGHAWEFMNKYEFTADKVTNTRVFTAGQHYTTCLPYKLQMNSALKAYTLDAASDNIFGFKQYTAKELDQFTPYVLIPSKGGNLLNNDESTVCYVTPTVNRGFMPLDENNNRQYLATPTGHIMYGSTIYMGWSSTYPITFDLYIMQSKNMWKKIPTARQSTYNKACVLPMRAYIMLPSHPQINGAVELDPAELIDNPSPSPSRELMPAKYIDTVDGIDAIETVEDWTDAEVYDLQGRKVDTTVRLPKGVYIVNGQKRIRK